MVAPLGGGRNERVRPCSFFMVAAMPGHARSDTFGRFVQAATVDAVCRVALVCCRGHGSPGPRKLQAMPTAYGVIMINRYGSRFTLLPSHAETIHDTMK